MFPCEFCEISESTLSTEHLGTTASKKSEASICFKNVFLSEAAFTDYCWQELTIFGSYLETFSQETHTKFCLSQLIVSAVNPINLFPLWGRGGGVILPSLPHSNFLKKFRKYKLMCAVLLWFISIWHILRDFQGSAVLGSLAVAILLEAPENFRKFIILYKFHFFWW